MAIRWPVSVLPPRSVAFDIAPRSLSAPANSYGISQVVASDAGIWRASFGDVYVRGEASVVTYRGIATILEGRVGTVLVPLCRGYQPIPDVILPGSGVSVPHSDGAYFSDGTGYVTSLINVYAELGAPVRATSITVRVAYAGQIMPGHHFSVGERLYRVKSFTNLGGGLAIINFRPPLREQVLVDATLEFDDPVCRMRLATDTEMDLTLEQRRQSNPTVNFIEDL